MIKRFVTVLLLLAPASVAWGDSQWVLGSSALTYHVSHPLHQVDGTSHEARGKGVCHAGQCEFLIAAPVKSFDSGDSNRDLHMLQVARGGQFPLVSVRATLPETAFQSTTIQVDLEIQFAGQTAHYKQVQHLQLVMQGSEIQDLRDDSGYFVRFQNRSTQAFDLPCQKRNSRAYRGDVASSVKSRPSFQNWVEYPEPICWD